MAFWPRCTEYFPSMDVNWHRVKGNMPRYEDHGEEWHHKVGFTKEEYGIYQGRKIMRLCHPLSQRHTKVPDTIVPGLKDGFDPGKWPIAQSYDDTLCHKLASKLVRWPSMPNIVTQVCLLPSSFSTHAELLAHVLSRPRLFSTTSTSSPAPLTRSGSLCSRSCLCRNLQSEFSWNSSKQS